MALATLAVAMGAFLAATITASPAQAADSAAAPAGASVSARSFTRVAIDFATISSAKPRAATVQTISTTAATPRLAAPPLVGFCTLNGVSGATSFIGCSVVAPVTVFILCDNGNIFSGFLEAPGVYSLTATPCFAIGYAFA